jgi:hypothetical protein
VKATKIFGPVIFLLLSFIKLSAQDIAIFTETGCRINSLYEKNAKAEDRIEFNINTFIDKPDFTILFANQIYKYYNNYNYLDYDTYLSVENKFSSFFHYFYLDLKKNSLADLKLMTLSNSVSGIKEEYSYFWEYGSDFYWQRLLDSYQFDILKGGIYFIKKNYFVDLSLHQRFNFKINQINYLKIDSDQIFNLNYDFKITTPLSEETGLSLGLLLNYNLNSTDSILFQQEELFDETCYNEQKVYLNIKALKKYLLLNPGVSFSRKEFLPVAVVEKYFEYNLNFNYYMDCILKNGMMIFFQGDVNLIQDDEEKSEICEIGVGFKTQFDIFVR